MYLVKSIKAVVLLLAFITCVSSSPIDESVAQVLNFMLHDTANPVVGFFDEMLFTTLPGIFGQEPSNQNGTKSEYKEYLLKDSSNDEAVHFTAVSIH